MKQGMIWWRRAFLYSATAVFAGILSVVGFGASAQADEAVLVPETGGKSGLAPIVIVPGDFEGGVEVYLTPNGYYVRTRRGDSSSPYPAINKAIEESQSDDGSDGGTARN